MSALVYGGNKYLVLGMKNGPKEMLNNQTRTMEDLQELDAKQQPPPPKARLNERKYKSAAACRPLQAYVWKVVLQYTILLGVGGMCDTEQPGLDHRYAAKDRIG
eukprot:376592-Pelagomonas_calceolata.AAC.1